MAHNIEKIEADDGLDTLISQMVNLSEHKLEWVYNDAFQAASQQLMPREGQVPVVFAYTRKALSRTLKRSAKTSCVAVLSHDGASDLFDKMLQKAKVAREQWHELSAAFPDSRGQSRRLILLPNGGGRNQPITVDELLLHAQARRVDDEQSVV